jgi:hypothetical protein
MMILIYEAGTIGKWLALRPAGSSADVFRLALDRMLGLANVAEVEVP